MDFSDKNQREDKKKKKKRPEGLSSREIWLLMQTQAKV